MSIVTSIWSWRRWTFLCLLHLYYIWSFIVFQMRRVETFDKTNSTCEDCPVCGNFTANCRTQLLLHFLASPCLVTDDLDKLAADLRQQVCLSAVTPFFFFIASLHVFPCLGNAFVYMQSAVTTKNITIINVPYENYVKAVQLHLKTVCWMFAGYQKIRSSCATRSLAWL